MIAPPSLLTSVMSQFYLIPGSSTQIVTCSPGGVVALTANMPASLIIITGPGETVIVFLYVFDVPLIAKKYDPLIRVQMNPSPLSRTVALKKVPSRYFRGST